MSESGITLENEYCDEDLYKIRICAFNGTFSGAVSLYTNEAELMETAGILAGFPRGRDDVREVSFGIAPSGSRAAARLRFACVDGAGHAYVEATIESDDVVGGIHQRAVVAVPIAAAQVDRFVAALRAMASLGADAERIAVL